MNPFADKIAWITGASSGIGRALAFALSKQGAKLILSARNTTELENVKKLCSHPENVSVLPLDLSDYNAVQHAAQQALAVFGGVDYLFNNGGISQRADAFETQEEVDRKIMEVNYFSNIALSKSLLPHFREKGAGYIIVTSSIAGKFGFYLRSAYSASKHALHGFYESLRLEEESNGIRVLLVCPGKVATDISVNALKGDGNAHRKMDQQQQDGVSAEYCAQQMLEGIKKNKEEIFIGGREIKAVKVKRFFPKLFGKIIRRQPRE